MQKLTICLSFVCMLLFAACAHAQVTVTNTSSAGWVQISPNTYGLPADLSAINCGSENETTCEPLGTFQFNVSFAGSGVLNILDEDGKTVSDQLQFFNDPQSGLGVVTFASDPTLSSEVDGGTSLCTEGLASANGCVQSFSILAKDGSTITLTAASDSEALFDPFGLKADSSDELQVTSGAVIASTPEPTTLLLVGSGLMGLALKCRRS
jgi:PEP-CTERM motif